MGVKFRIENIEVDGAHCYVSVSLVEGDRFAVSSGSKLGGIRLVSEVHKSMHGTYLFRLESTDDSSKLSAGEIVELSV